MSDKYIEQIAKELNDKYEWMKDPISIVADTNITLDDLIENSGDDAYEIIVDIHLINGDVVTLKNECLRSFERKRYMGAEIELDSEPGNVMANINTYDSVYHSISIPISSICWIDSHSEEIDWEEYKRIKEIKQKMENKELTLNEYQKAAMTTCMPSCENFSYMTLNLMGELGEFTSKIGKLIRKGKAHIENSKLVFHDDVTEEEMKAIRAEGGDIAWQLFGLFSVFGWDANSICQENLDKLASRKDRGKIDGNGDFR